VTPVGEGAYRPLADQLRPQSLDEFVGQPHLLAPGAPLRRALESGHPHSMILWGPPGTGKTTLARLVAKGAKAEFGRAAARQRASCLSGEKSPCRPLGPHIPNELFKPPAAL